MKLKLTNELNSNMKKKQTNTALSAMKGHEIKKLKTIQTKKKYYLMYVQNNKWITNMTYGYQPQPLIYRLRTCKKCAELNWFKGADPLLILINLVCTGRTINI